MTAGLVAGLGATAAMAMTAGAHAVWRRCLGPPPRDLPGVLAYHKVGTPELGGTWCTRRQFEAQLDRLLRCGFQGIDRGTFESRLTGLQTVAPAAPGRREFLLTFDDAYADFARHAWPAIQQRRLPLLLFVISDYVGRRARWDLPLPGRHRRHLSWEELRQLQQEGVEIGSHGATHCDLRRLSDEALERELSGSKKRLEDALGCVVGTLSYPYGRFDARVLEAARDAGYGLGFSMCPPGRNDRVQPLALRRFGVYVIDSPWSILDKVDGTRRLHWLQDIATRGINAVAEWPARWGSTAAGMDRTEKNDACSTDA